MIAKARGDIDDAVRRYESARSIAIDVNDAPRTAQILNNLGNLLRQRGDLDAALGAFEESLEARRAMRDRLGVAACFNNLATTETVRGDFEEALALASTAFALFEELGDLRGVLIASLNLAELEIEIGSYEHAREHIERSSELARTSGSKPLEATALAHRARLAERQGDLASAESHARAMLASFGESAPKPLRTRALATLLDVCSRTDRSEEADSARDEAHALIETALDSAAALEFAIASAMHTARIGDLAAARDELELSLAALAAAPRVLRARASCALGTIYRDLGPDWADRVERHFEHAIKEFADMGALRDLALARTEYSHYWSLLGEDEAAASLLEPLET